MRGNVSSFTNSFHTAEFDLIDLFLILNFNDVTVRRGDWVLASSVYPHSHLRFLLHFLISYNPFTSLRNSCGNSKTKCSILDIKFLFVCGGPLHQGIANNQNIFHRFLLFLHSSSISSQFQI